MDYLQEIKNVLKMHLMVYSSNSGRPETINSLPTRKKRTEKRVRYLFFELGETNVIVNNYQVLFYFDSLNLVSRKALPTRQTENRTETRVIVFSKSGRRNHHVPQRKLCSGTATLVVAASEGQPNEHKQLHSIKTAHVWYGMILHE